MPSYPVVALTILPVEATDPVVYACLDVARAAHRAVLEALARHATLMLLLYDADYLPVVARTLIAPLEENAARIGRDARDALQRLSPQARSFERARGAFLSPAHDRLGRIHVALSDVELGRLTSPSALRAAVATVGRWSEPGAEAYLVEVRSYPLPRWRKVRADVVRAAVEQGMHCPKALALQVLAAEKVDADWPAVLRRQVSAFTEVALRIRPNDLSPDEEAENWRLLSAECQAASVQLDPQVERLARSADRRAQAVQGGGVDLRALGGPELIALLERKELRREAALILCERKDPEALAPIFAALRSMTRAEANRVLAALTFFGEAAEKQLCEGLRSRKSFVRQGCALALGQVGGALAAESLARVLVEEPTEIWREVARALGDLGAEAVAPLAQKVRAADAERRERVARALAHVVGRGARTQVEQLAAGRDPAAAEAARRAQTLEAEVRAADLEVRGGPAPADQTVVRAFSRRFFEAMGGAVELSADDLEVVEDEGEPLDDEDLALMDAGDLPPSQNSDLPKEPTQRRPRLPSGRAP
jgi:hypothetical protein